MSRDRIACSQGVAAGWIQLLVFNTLLSACIIGASPIADAVIMDSFDDRSRARATGCFYGAINGLASPLLCAPADETPTIGDLIHGDLLAAATGTRPAPGRSSVPTGSASAMLHSQHRAGPPRTTASDDLPGRSGP